MKKLMVVGYAGLALLGAACGGSAGSGSAATPIPAVTPTATGAVTEAQIASLARQVFPAAGGSYSVCGADGRLAGCPYSDRLKTRLAEIKQTLLRAQNPSHTLQVTAELMSPETGIAHVALFSGREKLDLWVTRQGGNLVVDDEICAGRKETSIYATPFVAC